MKELIFKALKSRVFWMELFSSVILIPLSLVVGLGAFATGSIFIGYWLLSMAFLIGVVGAFTKFVLSDLLEEQRNLIDEHTKDTKRVVR